nr:Rep [Kummerowia striata geminiviridae]
MPRVTRFHVKAKGWFLTYPQADDITLDEVYEFFLAFQLANKSPKKILVAKEKHLDGHDHFHVFISFDARVDCHNEKAFDIPVSPTRAKHPNIQAARSESAVIGYCTKNGDDVNFRANFNFKIPEPKETVAEVLQRCATKEEFLTACLSSGQSWSNARSWIGINKMADDHYRPKTSKVHEPVLTLDKFINVPDAIKEFIRDLRGRKPGDARRVKSIWLWGESQTGKTTLAENLGRFLRVKNQWNVDNLGGETAELCVLDDLAWDTLAWKDNYKSLLGCQVNCSFTGKYRAPVNLRWGIPAAVCTNELPLFTLEQQRWLDKNVVFVHIQRPLVDSSTFLESDDDELHASQLSNVIELLSD